MADYVRDIRKCNAIHDKIGQPPNQLRNTGVPITPADHEYVRQYAVAEAQYDAEQYSSGGYCVRNGMIIEPS